MIYDCYWNGATRRLDFSASVGGADSRLRWHGKDSQEGLAKAIKVSKNDTFVFITTKSQEPGFKEWMEKNGMKDYLFFEMKQLVSNGNYPGEGPKLMLRVFKSK